MRRFLYMFGLGILVFLFNFVAIFFHWYDTYHWFDIPMHFLGGVAVVVFALQAWELYGKTLTPTPSIPLAIKIVAIIGFVTFIGVLWEWYEFFLDQYVPVIRNLIGLSQSSVADTMLDLFMDVFGGTCTLIVFEGFLRKKV